MSKKVTKTGCVSGIEKKEVKADFSCGCCGCEWTDCEATLRFFKKLGSRGNGFYVGDSGFYGRSRCPECNFTTFSKNPVAIKGE